MSSLKSKKLSYIPSSSSDDDSEYGSEYEIEFHLTKSNINDINEEEVSFEEAARLILECFDQLTVNKTWNEINKINKKRKRQRKKLLLKTNGRTPKNTLSKTMHNSKKFKKNEDIFPTIFSLF